MSATFNRELRTYNHYLTYAAICFFFIATLLVIVTPTMFGVLDDANIKAGRYTVPYMQTSPDWISTLYGTLSWLLLALLIWIILNVIDGICRWLDDNNIKTIRDLLQTTPGAIGFAIIALLMVVLLRYELRQVFA